MKKILIVDDASFMRMSLRSMLENHGFEVVGEAADGESSIQIYKETNPDLVTMDITMPGMDGIQALKEIKKYDSKAKVVMISSMGQESFVREAIIHGAVSFIVKPFKEEQVVTTLTKIAAM